MLKQECLDRLHNIFYRLFEKPSLKLKLAVYTSVTDNGVMIADYHIIKRESRAFIKPTYDIYNMKSKKYTHRNLGLFQSAKKIVEAEYSNKSDIKKIVELDKAYLGALLEMDLYRLQMSKLNSDDIKYDILYAKTTAKQNIIEKLRHDITQIGK